jgi:hypothetical protein
MWNSSPTASNIDNLIDNNSLTNVDFDSNNIELLCTFNSISQDKIINRFNLSSNNSTQLFNQIQLYASNNLNDKGLPKLVIDNQNFVN